MAPYGLLWRKLTPSHSDLVHEGLCRDAGSWSHLGPRHGNAWARLGTLGIQAGQEHEQQIFWYQVAGAASSARSWRQRCRTKVTGAAVHFHGVGCHTERWQGQKEQTCVVFSHIPCRKEVCYAVLPCTHTCFFNRQSWVLEQPAAPGL